MHSTSLSRVTSEDIEAAALRAWPALVEESLPGWHLRFANGFTKRSNSANLVDSDAAEASQNIGACERSFRRVGLPAIFRLPALHEATTEIDAELERRGYARIETSHVLYLQLDTAEVPALASQWEHVFEHDAAAWLDRVCRLRGDDLEIHATHAKLLARMPVPRRFTTLEQANEPCACLAVNLTSGLVGLFDLFTAAHVRGRGHARSILVSSLAWAREHGAHGAYIQVVADNHTALRLYASLGFEELYRYWYRAKPTP